MAARTDQPTATFNSLRRVLPTLGNCIGLDDTDHQSLSNWQDIQHAPHGGKRGRAAFPVGHHYADGPHEQRAWIKLSIMTECVAKGKERLNTLNISDDPGAPRWMPRDAWTWSSLRATWQAPGPAQVSLEASFPPLLAGCGFCFWRPTGIALTELVFEHSYTLASCYM